MKTRYLRMIKRQRGFTLIELLAVILILGIIALIAIPTVTNVVEESRQGAFKNSVDGLAKSVSNYCMTKMVSGEDVTGFYFIEDGKVDLALDIKGKIPDTGLIEIGYNCKVTMFVTDFNYYASYEDDKLIMSDAGSFKFFKDINDLKKSDLKKGDEVITFSYTDVKKGGGAKYIVTDSGTPDDKIYIGLNNGLIAKYELTDYANIRSFGANGTTDDFDIVNYLISNEITKIYIPEGDYDFNHTEVIFPVNVSLKGNRDKTIFRNINFTANYGISLDSLTIIGGTNRRVSATGVNNADGNIMINSTPIGKQQLSYNNCNFYDADYVSVALSASLDNNYFTNDEVSNCHFENIKFASIYHRVSSDKGYYHDNSFKNLGDVEALKGFRNAFMIGDISNNTNVKYKEVIIENNVFDTLNTKDDFERQVHVINANFIAVHGYTITINNNKIYNLNGYGEDREAIYTKGEMVYVTNNYVKNGGLGEAYICLKQSNWKGVPHSVVKGNTIEGEYGAAIRTYQGTEISNNKITLTHGREGISSNNKNEEENFTVVIKDNDININISNYYVNGEIVEDLKPKGGIYYHHPYTDINITNNKVVLTTDDDVVDMPGILVTYSRSNILVKDNDVTSSSIGIGIYNTNNGIDVNIDSNKLKVSSTPILVRSVDTGITESNKVVKILNNDITSDKTQQWYVDFKTTKTSSLDTLYLTPGNHNNNFTSSYAHMDGGYLVTDDTNLVTGKFTIK